MNNASLVEAETMKDEHKIHSRWNTYADMGVEDNLQSIDFQLSLNRDFGSKFKELQKQKIQFVDEMMSPMFVAFKQWWSCICHACTSAFNDVFGGQNYGLQRLIRMTEQHRKQRKGTAEEEKNTEQKINCLCYLCQARPTFG